MAAHLELRIDSTKEVHAVCLDVDLASVAGPVKPAELRMDDELLSCLLGQVPVSARDVHTADTELANLSMEQWLQLIGLQDNVGDVGKRRTNRDGLARAQSLPARVRARLSRTIGVDDLPPGPRPGFHQCAGKGFACGNDIAA